MDYSETKIEMSKVKSYLSLIKFSHTIFALPFAMIGFFLAYSEYANSLSEGNQEFKFKLEDQYGITVNYAILIRFSLVMASRR